MFMEILILSAIAAATVPAMLYQTISNKSVQWVLLGLLLTMGFGTLIALSLMESGQTVLGDTVLTKVNIVPFGLGYLLVLNLLVVPLLYWIDKRHANENVLVKKRNDRSNRIPETAMHTLTAMGGAFGAFTSQQLFHHKRNKGSFQLVFLLTILTSFAIYYGLWLAVEPDMARLDAWFKNSNLFNGLNIPGK